MEEAISHFTFTFSAEAQLEVFFDRYICYIHSPVIHKNCYYCFLHSYPHSTVESNGSYKWVVYYDPSIVYLGPSHIVYAIITLILSFMILVVPVILLFNAFVDAFQGCYKDGTRDCRYFAALQLLLRILVTFFFVVVKNTVVSVFLSSVILGIYTTLFVIAKP